MTLYYSPGACSPAPHIVLREAGIAFDLVKVDIPNKKTEHDSSPWIIDDLFFRSIPQPVWAVSPQPVCLNLEP